VRLPGESGTIAVTEIESRLDAMLRERHDVVAVETSVENRHRRGLLVAARIAVTPDARLDETIAAAGLLAEAFAHDRLGLPLAAPPRFALRYEELDLRAGRTDDLRANRARRRASDDRNSTAG
jgi:hypothetical protein